MAETHDLVNILWVAEGRGLLYATSPIYDKPGIYFFDVRTGKTSLVAKPTHKRDPAYPDGADWFVLCSAEPVGIRGVIVHYIHLPDVDSVNFKAFPYDASQETDTIWLRF